MAKKAVLSSVKILDAFDHAEEAHEAPCQVQYAIDLADHQELVSKAAYFIAEHRKFAPGHEMSDWLAAEADIFGVVY